MIFMCFFMGLDAFLAGNGDDIIASVAIILILSYLLKRNIQKNKDKSQQDADELKQEKEVQLKKIIKLLYDNKKEKADTLIANWNEENPDYKFTDNHIDRRFKKYSEKMKLKEEKAKERQRKRDEKEAKAKAHKAKLAKAKKARKEKIYNLLELDGGKLPASDIDFKLKFKNVERTKGECEEMYKRGRIGRTGNFRYFV
jgi:hypothetical protein